MNIVAADNGPPYLQQQLPTPPPWEWCCILCFVTTEEDTVDPILFSCKDVKITKKSFAYIIRYRSIYSNNFLQEYLT